MRVREAGHEYWLNNFEDTTINQPLRFINKVDGKTIYDGTTNEDVLEMLIDRMKFLNGKFPCRENSIVITKLEEALMWLNRRTALRQAQGVEGKDLSHKS